MKALLPFLLLLLFSHIVTAQDTIFVKSGAVIPAVILEKGDVEIKYKKFGPPETAAIYTVFISDLTSIHYENGIIADYTQSGQNSPDDQAETALDLAGTMQAIKFGIGLSGNYFNRNTSDNLLAFWRYRNGDNSLDIGGNPYYYPLNLKMLMTIGQSRRNLLGAELQLILTPADAIFASTEDGLSEINLRAFYYNIIMIYGHTLNHKKTFMAIIEPGFDLAFMSGDIKLNDTEYKISANIGTGFHLALGTDWIISKRLMASFRVGQRFMTVKRIWYENSNSSTGYATLYINPTPPSDDLVNVKWNGPYASLGLSWSFYSKMKTGRPQ
jgi:hypothetical protein